ncbi:MAG: SemiSWEET family transporter [Candidatus Omnitrophica bacterium]|nr:SemiSWEET family transporter [Candidatus Omnitrophota bacterium]
MIWSIVGLAASTLTMFSFVPQIVRAIRTHSLNDFSIITLIQFTLGVFLWILYGVHLRDPIIIMANVVSLVTLTVLLVLYVKFKSLPAGRQGEKQ